jgi:hypothetical protein
MSSFSTYTPFLGLFSLGTPSLDIFSNMVQYWRAAGFSFLKYQRLCAHALRTSLKEPHKAKALDRDAAVFNIAEWKNGKALKGGKTCNVK